MNMHGDQYDGSDLQKEHQQMAAEYQAKLKKHKPWPKRIKFKKIYGPGKPKILVDSGSY